MSEKTISKNDYDKALDDASFTLKILCFDMTFKERKTIFNYELVADIIKNYTLKDVIDKVSAYIYNVNVGDEVVYVASGTMAIVIYVDAEIIRTVDKHGITCSFADFKDLYKYARKTGKHYPKMAETMIELGKED